MKKSCFIILCMVLIIALLAPNVFAATPAPEAPLADAATVARVKQETAKINNKNRNESKYLLSKIQT